MEKTPADVLEEAADLLLIHGRCTGEGRRDDGTLCVLGAMATAVVPAWHGSDRNYFTVVESHEAANSAMRALDRRLNLLDVPGLPPHSASCADLRVAWWNDSTRGEDLDFEVIDTLRSVAKDLRNEVKS